MSEDEKRLAEIVAGFNGRTRYEGQPERADEFLWRLLSERTAELERVRARHETTCRDFHNALAALSDATARAERAEASLAAALRPGTL